MVQIVNTILFTKGKKENIGPIHEILLELMQFRVRGGVISQG